MTVEVQSQATLIDNVKEDVIKWRRYLHQHPELSFQEIETSQFVYDTLSSFGGLELSRPTKTSVVARLTGSQPGKTLAIRADMDALPITEETDYEFKSQNPGIMHACGHDGHTAILLGTAKVLTRLRDKINGEVRFIFQHAEEQPPGGAIEMVRAGVMDGVDMVIGLHLMTTVESGQIGITSGPTSSNSDTFEITVLGKGGHGAMPQDAVDSVAIAGQVLTNLQHIVSRNTDPLDSLVVSATKIHGGSANNVIPDKVEIGGTVRSFNPETRDKAPKLMERLIKNITEAHGANYEFKYNKGYSSVYNDELVTSNVREALVEAFGEEVVQHTKPFSGSEDFSGFLTKAPGTYFWVGTGNQEKNSTYPHHHPKFALDEDSMEMGVKAFVHSVFKLLN
ncbi:amidohydrolase [Scopulibacillus darangshiensis]|uniref:Amidohydrolase n=1 Tax=Scopulibacillus darangshiensis TaxID=442528 RepID=A0A4R2P7J0_9BACL|nr:M20 family metallopeptidase [Scopulibacillus darangshiensis]TCP30909.1 amidohydrolase [Scopulibacillus darangshiensis]